MSVRHTALLMLIGTLIATLASAQYIIIYPPPHPPLPRPIIRPPLPKTMTVERLRILAELNEHAANVNIEAVFKNPCNQRIEGVWVFPVPKEAAVSSFTMTANGQTLEAELLEAGKARSIYEDIVRRMKDPGLLEYADDGLLRARVFPIEPHAKVTIKLSYEQKLGLRETLTHFSCPFGKDKGNEPTLGTNIEIRLKTKAPIKTLYTPGFTSEIKRVDNQQATIEWESAKHQGQGDFELLFSTDRQAVSIDVMTYVDDKDGYFMAVVAPMAQVEAEEIAAKDLTFVIDTSGSMSGKKMQQAKDALSFCVRNLNPDDTFRLIAFASSVNPLSQGPLPATSENVKLALDFIDGLRARGGTAIHEALQMAYQQSPRTNAVPMIVFMTDGLPTVGETDAKKISSVADEKYRVFSFGVGHDVNTRLLDTVASSSRGYTTYVAPDEDLELALSSFYLKIAMPAMTDLKLIADGFRMVDIMPSPLPDLFYGSQMTIVGRYDPAKSKKGQFKLTGKLGQESRSFSGEVDLTGSLRNTFIPRLWAIRRVGFLQEQIRLNGDSGELINEIKELGRRYGIVTPYTSFLIVEDSLPANQRVNVRRELREQEELSRGDSGAQAFDAARSIQTYKSADHAESVSGLDSLMKITQSPQYNPGTSTNNSKRIIFKQVGDKTFYYRHGKEALYDSLIPAGQEPTIDLELELYSDDFFTFLRKHPGLATYLSAGEHLIIQLDGRTILIKPPAEQQE